MKMTVKNGKKMKIKEWEPFSDYATPCYVLYGGELAVYTPELSPVPILVRRINDIAKNGSTSNTCSDSKCDSN